ncbi:MAG: hypothetical protein Q7I89_01435 [Syntrophales bacterium]|nr:hypothetical protein [Syntrophales bacterium]
MKRRSILIVFCTFLVFGLFAANVFAQDKQITLDQPVVQEQTRVIVEEIVLSDPTVAQPKKWLIGLSGEYWYVYNQYNRWENGVIAAEGSMTGGMPGGTIIVGYDAFTVAYSYRKGDFNCDITYADLPNKTSVLKSNQTEHEITARWLFKVSPHFNPYVVVGYNHTTKDDEETLDAAHDWGAPNFSRVTKNLRTYKSPLFGLGAIIPFNKYIGVRVEGRGLYSWSDRVQDDGAATWSGSGVGAAAVATGYWNIWKGLNAQIGGKYQWLNGGYYNVGNSWKLGAFAMLGYTHKF